MANAGDPEQAEACVAATVERFGAVDILVNNAATNPYYGPIIELDTARADKTVRVNQTGLSRVDPGRLAGRHVRRGAAWSSTWPRSGACRWRAASAGTT